MLSVFDDKSKRCSNAFTAIKDCLINTGTKNFQSYGVDISLVVKLVMPVSNKTQVVT